MSGIVFEDVAFGRLLRSNFAFAAGLHIVTGTEHEGLSEIALLSVGVEAPRRGKVRVLGTDPERSPSTRKSMAHLLANAELIAAPNVRTSVEAALKLRAHADADKALSNAGLANLALRKLTSLTSAERNAVALAIALAHPQPKLVILHEPLCVSSDFRREYLFDRVQHFVENGAVGLITTSSTRDAHAFAGTHVTLARGEITRATDAQLALGERALRVTTDKPRELAEQLLKSDQVSGVVLRAESADSAELEVHGAELEAVARSVEQAAQRIQANLQGLEAVLPSVEELYAARLGAQRAAYERAYTNARPRAPEPARSAFDKQAAPPSVYGSAPTISVAAPGEAAGLPPTTDAPHDGEGR